MGRADILMRFLQLVGMDRPRDLERYSENLENSLGSPPLVAQVADRILGDNPEFIEMYRQAWEELYQSNPYEQQHTDEPSIAVSLAFTSFIKEWVEFEKAVGEFMKRTGAMTSQSESSEFARSPITRLIHGLHLSPYERESIIRLRNIRNEVVHGRRPPDEATLRLAAEELASLRNRVESQHLSRHDEDVDPVSLA